MQNEESQAPKNEKHQQMKQQRFYVPSCTFIRHATYGIICTILQADGSVYIFLPHP